MDDLAQRRLDDFLNQVSSRAPTPGGGSVTAAAGALACALARMVVAFSTNKKTDAAMRERVQQVAGRLRTADELLRALITQDSAAYLAMTAARRAGPNASAYADAVMGAVTVPMEIAAVATSALATMDDFKSSASRYLLSDLAVAAVLAEATTRAARYTALVNVAELRDHNLRVKFLGDIDRMIERGSGHCRSIEGFVQDHLENGPDTGR